LDMRAVPSRISAGTFLWISTPSVGFKAIFLPKPETAPQGVYPNPARLRVLARAGSDREALDDTVRVALGALR
jgi:hypothetical protein